MALHSIVTKIATGSSNQFSVSFTGGFIERDHVSVRVNNEVDGVGDPATRAITWITDGILLVGGALAGAGEEVVFTRKTPILTAINDYVDGTVLSEAALDLSFEQLLNSAQEQDDRLDTITVAQDAAAAADGSATAAAASAAAALVSETAASAAASALTTPFKNGSVVQSYDPGTLTAHPGALLFEPTENRVYRVYSEAKSHLPVLGMTVYIDQSDSNGVEFKNKRAIYPGRAGLKVLAMAGRWLNGRMLVIVNTENAGGTRFLEKVYSDDNGSTWTTADIPQSGGVNHFMYDALHARNTAAGGDDDDGAIFYAYTNGIAYAFHTDDKGATFTEVTVLTGSSAYLDNDGVSQTGMIPTEIATAQVGEEAKFVHYMRGHDQPYLIAFTSTDMITFVNAKSSGIYNVSPSGTVGTPPHLFNDNGRMWLALFGRENWAGTDVAKEGSIEFYGDPPSTVYDNGGVFSSLVSQATIALPSRAIGMMSHVLTNQGTVAMARAGESVYSSSGNPMTSQIYLFTSQQIPDVLCSPRPNLFDNSNFDIVQRGDTFTGVTANSTPVVDRWKLFCSGSTMSATITDIDPLISSCLPHRPKQGLRVVGTSHAYMGLEQVFYGKNQLHSFADKELTVSFYAVGVVPGTRVVVEFDYGSGGSADVTTSSNFTTGVSIADGLTYLTASVFTPTTIGKTLTSTAKVTVRFDTPTTTAVDYVFAGVKLENGNGSTLLEAADIDMESVTCQRYYKKLPAVLNVTRLSTVQGVAAVGHSTMVKRPDFSGSLLTTGFSITHTAGAVALTGITISRQDDEGFRLDLAHASTTAYDHGQTFRDTSGAQMALDCELP